MTPGAQSGLAAAGVSAAAPPTEAGLWVFVLLAAVVAIMLAVKPLREWFARTRTAVAILTIVAALAAIGVGIGQNLPHVAYTDRYGSVVGSLLVRSGLTSVFTAWYSAFACSNSP